MTRKKSIYLDEEIAGMIVYLTSSFIPYREENSKSFFADLKKEWKKDSSVLYVPCDPEAKQENEQQKNAVLEALSAAKLSVKDVTMLKEKNPEPLEDMIAAADVIYLAGGHAPTQLAFMKKVGLNKKISSFDGIVLALSSGSMNSAYSVYLTPEEEGEAVDPNYVRFSDGLDLTNIQIIPHKQAVAGKKIDGLDYIKEVIVPDSYGRRFYLISDGSYFKIKDGKTSFKGTGDIIEDGVITPLKQGTIVPYMGYFEQTVIKALLADGYDMVVSVQKNTEACEVYYLYEKLSNLFESSKLRYTDICFRLSQKVVEEERESFLDQLRIPVILKELKEKGDFVRTVHIETNHGRRLVPHCLY